MKENGGWGITDHLLATVIEFEHGTARAALAPYVKHPPKPFVYPRPGAVAQKPSKSWIKEWATAAKGVSN